MGRGPLDRSESIELDLDPTPAPPPRNRYRTVTWSLIVVLLLVLGVGALFVQHVHQPLADALARTMGERDAANAELEVVGAERDGLRTERDALRTERDGLVAERDSLRGREQELASAVAQRDAQIGELQAMADSLSEQLREEIAAGDVTVEQANGRVQVRLADQILFAPGQAVLSERGRAVLRRVATSLARMEDRTVQVEGHTDSTPLRGAAQEEFGTNWELSAARATHVVRFLAEDGGIAGERLVAAGFGEFHPVGDNRTAQGRRRNRRIELTLIRRP